MNLRRILASTLAVGALALGSTAVAVAAPASAHTPEATATCSSLDVALENYSVGRNGDFINSVRVEVDSTVVGESDFGKSHRESYALGDPTVAHDYLVEVDASGTQYDREFSGSSVPCPRAAAPDANVAVSVVPPTCDTAGSLVLGEPVNATWGAPTAVAGPGRYSVAATAAAGHTFADGATVKDFAGVLAGVLDPALCVAVVVPPVVVPPVVPPVVTPPVVTPPVVTPPVVTPPVVTPPVDPPTTVIVVTPEVPTPEIVTPEIPSLATPPAIDEPLTPAAVAIPVPLVPLDVTPAPADVTDPPAQALAVTGSDAAAVAPIGVAILLAGIALLITRRLVAGRADRR
jgi:hypothetical protein